MRTPMRSLKHSARPGGLAKYPGGIHGRIEWKFQMRMKRISYREVDNETSEEVSPDRGEEKGDDKQPETIG